MNRLSLSAWQFLWTKLSGQEGIPLATSSWGAVVCAHPGGNDTADHSIWVAFGCHSPVQRKPKLYCSNCDEVCCQGSSFRRGCLLFGLGLGWARTLIIGAHSKEYEQPWLHHWYWASNMGCHTGTFPPYVLFHGNWVNHKYSLCYYGTWSSPDWHLRKLPLNAHIDSCLDWHLAK